MELLPLLIVASWVWVIWECVRATLMRHNWLQDSFDFLE
jgi:hypothetical protein